MFARRYSTVSRQCCFSDTTLQGWHCPRNACCFLPSSPIPVVFTGLATSLVEQRGTKSNGFSESEYTAEMGTSVDSCEARSFSM